MESKEKCTDYISIMDKLGTKQMILQGPPGTSKTYQAKEIVAIALGWVKDKKENGEKDTRSEYDQISYFLNNGEPKKHWRMVQFHPSYGYEDFVRGITVETENHHVIYKTVNKVFGEICEKAEGDTWHNYFLIIDELNRADVATVFGELLYALEYREEPVSIPYKLDADRKTPDNGETKLNVPDKLHVTAATDKGDIFFSYSLDTEKEEPKNEEKTPDDGRDKLTVPKNLYVIATMNTADKSVGNLDYAIRRRFVFFDCPPKRKTIKDYLQEHWKDCPHEDILALFDGVNNFVDDTLSDTFRNIDFRIGHTYFMPKYEDGKPWEAAKKEVQLKFQYQVLPILREYASDGLLNLQNDKDDKLPENLKNYLNGKTEIVRSDDDKKPVITNPKNEVELKKLIEAFKEYKPKQK